MKFTMSYLKFLPSNSLHVTLFANDEFVGHNMVFWVVLDPCDIISVLDDLCHELEVMAPWDDIIRDTWGERDRISIEWFLKDHVTLTEVMAVYNSFCAITGVNYILKCIQIEKRIF